MDSASGKPATGGSFDDATHDKQALAMAEDMMDDGSGAAEGNINVASVEAEDIKAQAEKEAEDEVNGQSLVPEAAVAAMA